MKKILFAIILIPICFTSCSVGGVWKNENINSEIQKTISDLNNQLIDAVLENNTEKLDEMLSEELKSKIKINNSELIEYISKDLSKENFKILDNFYWNNVPVGKSRSISSETPKKRIYRLDFTANTKENIISIGYYGNDKFTTSLLILYGKGSDGWKINVLNVQTFEVNKKDAIEWCRQSQESLSEGKYINAYTDITVANSLLKPGGKLWTYDVENVINKYSDSIMTSINTKYEFPIEIETIASKPKIFAVNHYTHNEGCDPVVQYTTIIDFNKKEQLQEECDLINDLISNIFYGITEDRKNLFYIACDKIPNGYNNNDVKMTEFIQKID